MTRTIKRSALKRLKASYRADSGNALLGPLTRHVMRKQAAEEGFNSTGEERRSDVMHPSDMSRPDWCPRHDYYRIIGAPQGKVSQANPSFTMANILTEGTNIHTKYQTWLWEMGVLFGWWYCNECSCYWEALAPNECPHCGSARIEYREVPLLNEWAMVAGHSDGAVHGLLDEDVLIEVKSIGIRSLAFEAPRLYEQYVKGAPAADIWFQINRPFGSHLKQGMFYLWLAAGRYNKIFFIYESKFNQQVKGFMVKYNPHLIVSQLNDIKDVAQGVRAGIAPDHPPWAAPDGPICQSCTYRRTCWDIKGNHVEDDQKENIRVVRTIGRKRKAALAKTNGRGT
jgi:hypothetical protein